MWKFIIISVKEDLNRRTHVNNVKIKLESYGFIVEIIDAIFWKTNNVIELLENLQITVSNLSKSQIACFLSHRLAWSKITNDKCIILEDDMDLTDIELFKLIENDLLNCNHDGVIMWKHPDKIPNKFNHITNNLVEFYFQWGLCAYNIHSELAEKMLNIKNINLPIDDYLYNNIFPLYKVYLTANDPFENLGFLGGYKPRNFTYKSLIYN